MKVSVIVAAYNAEKYVTETMESLANQSIDDYEIIVVNDGSKDRTWEMIEELHDQDPLADFLYKSNVVTDEQQAHFSFSLQLKQQLNDLCLGLYV